MATRSLNKKIIRNTLRSFNLKIATEDRERVEGLGRCKNSALTLFNLFCATPQMTISDMCAKTKLSRPTITNTIKKMLGAGIICDATPERKGGKIYRYNRLLGSTEEFKSTVRSQNKHGLYLHFEGREQAEKDAESPTRATFKPYDYHNNKPQNKSSYNKLYIGDNLDVMKCLKNEKAQFDLIYFDPPYAQPSTREKPAYKDTFDGLCDFLRMLYPRLCLAKDLLAPDGLVVISISEHALAQTKQIMNEIFGYENFVNNISIEVAVAAGPLVGHTANQLPNIKAYLLVYAKDAEKVNYLNRLYEKAETKFTSGYNVVIDEDLNKIPLVEYLKQQPEIAKLFKKHNLPIKISNVEPMMYISQKFESYIYQKLAKILYKATVPCQNPLKCDFCAPTERVFVYEDKLLEKNKNGTVRHYKAFYGRLQKDDSQTLVNSNIRGDVWKKYYSDKNTVQTEGGVHFSAGKKPLRLILDLLKWVNKKNARVLEGFAGSSPVGHAVWHQNKVDGGERQFVAIQIKESVQEGSIEAKQGFKTVNQITIKRLKNAANKIGTSAGFQIYYQR